MMSWSMCALRCTLFLGLGVFSGCLAFRYDEEWNDFKADFKKSYSGDLEEQARREIFESNMKYIEEHNNNAEKHGFELGVNEFTDLKPKEFVQRFARCHLPVHHTGTHPHSNHNNNNINNHNNNHNNNNKDPQVHTTPRPLPPSVDWTARGVVGPVDSEGQCGSCYAFTVTGALQAHQAIKSGCLVPLSGQQLIDCSGKFGNYGCNGGTMDGSYRYIQSTGGLDSAESYPYVAKDQTCRFNRSSVAASCSGYVDLPPGNETALQAAVAWAGPVAVAFDATHLSFQTYKSGVYYEPQCSNTTVEHSAVVVGYGAEAGKDYWLVKNSWGVAWGDKGYIKMARNRGNNCGIANMASYPTV